MNDWLTLEAYVGRPGAESDLLQSGVRTIAAVDTGAEVTAVPEELVEKIYDSIRAANVIIAEVSVPNPNVFYEIGFAHALGKPVVLLSRGISSSPFDLRGYNHIVYRSIVELRKSLESMLRQLLK
jgi:nucleoside 2-deoxyribosyltransferase